MERVLVAWATANAARCAWVLTQRWIVLLVMVAAGGGSWWLFRPRRANSRRWKTAA